MASILYLPLDKSSDQEIKAYNTYSSPIRENFYEGGTSPVQISLGGRLGDKNFYFVHNQFFVLLRFKIQY